MASMHQTTHVPRVSASRMAPESWAIASGPRVCFPHPKPHAGLVGYVVEADLEPIVAQLFEKRGDPKPLPSSATRRMTPTGRLGGRS